MDIALITALGTLGYYLNKNGRSEKQKINDVIVRESDKPSGQNIYQNRHMENVFTDELNRATNAHEGSKNPDVTKWINGATYKTYPNNEYNKNERIYSKSDRLVQTERDIKRATPYSTTKLPSSTINEVYKTSSLIDKEYTEEMGTKKFNEKRNMIPNPRFELHRTNDDQTLFKTVYSNERKDGKSVNVYEKGHNNMEPFFGGSVKQNLRDDANRTLLENHTGTSPVYKHKKEVKRLFPVVKNPFAVGGLPVPTNRETERYIPAITHQNTLPFEQQKVAPGLNKSMTDNSSTVGFHDDYRPLGQGKYKTVNELRVNPKNTYKGRIVGEKFFVTKQEKSKPVVSRKHVDLSYTTIEPTKEGFANTQTNKGYKYRSLEKNGVQVKKGEVLSQDTIILKNTDRIDYEDKIGNLHGTAKYSTDRNQNYYYDKAKETIKQQTEDNKHSHINTYGEVKRNQNNPYDIARQTIKQQTQDNIHSHINTKSSSYEQSNRGKYENATINALKELTVHRRKPTQVGTKYNSGKEVVNLDVRRTQFDTYDKTRRKAPTDARPIDKIQIGQVTNQRNVYDDQGLLSDRINPYNVQQFNSNPYTQKLSSYEYPYNPAYPQK
jgi:hypothetical protein